MVKDDLLVIKTQDRETRGRKTCQEVHKKLVDMLKNCEDDSGYACDPAPRLIVVDGEASEGHRRRCYQLIDSIDSPKATSSDGPGASDIKQF